MIYLPYRGKDEQRMHITPELGKFLWSTDTNQIWVGDGKTKGGLHIGKMPKTVQKELEASIFMKKEERIQQSYIDKLDQTWLGRLEKFIKGI